MRGGDGARGNDERRLRPNVKQFNAKNIVLPARLATINVITRRKITTFRVNFNMRSKVYAILPIYDCKELHATTILLKLFKNTHELWI